MRSTVIACALALGSVLPASSFAQGSANPTEAAQVQRGQRLFIRCSACHEAGEPKIAKVGPHLKGIVGRPAGKLEGYNFSKGLAAAGFEWDEARLLAWMERPSALIPDTTMVLEGIAAENDRRALLAYLRTLR